MSLPSVDLKQFDTVLTKIMKSEERIKKVILVDKSGLTISHVSRFSYFPQDIDGIGVIASAVFCASEEQGLNLNIGELGIVTSEFESGKIFASSCGRGVLCVITEPSVNIGIVRLVMKKAKTELSEKLDTFLQAQSVTVRDISTDATPVARPSLRKDELEAALRELERL